MGSKRPALTRAATVAAVAVALLATGASTAVADGDGDCTDTGNICVFNQQQPTSYHNGYYDLNDPHPNFHGKYYLIKRAYLGDSISAASNAAKSPTSCAGFTFYWDTGYGGTSYFAGRNFKTLTFYENNDEFSSFRKTGC